MTQLTPLVSPDCPSSSILSHINNTPLIHLHNTMQGRGRRETIGLWNPKHHIWIHILSPISLACECYRAFSSGNNRRGESNASGWLPFTQSAHYLPLGWVRAKLFPFPCLFFFFSIWFYFVFLPETEEYAKFETADYQCPNRALLIKIPKTL